MALSLPFRLIAVASFVNLLPLPVQNAAVVVEPSGFTANLIHRDSPSLPFHNSSATRFESLRRAVQRSIARAKRFKRGCSIPKWKKIHSDMIPSGGEFYMYISMGTPPVQTLVIADTGSDLMWTQCLPCKKCYEQKPPLFDPGKSSTFRTLPCNSRSCKELDGATCENRTCAYQISYGDGSYTGGNVAAETFTLGSLPGRTVSLRGIAFGCAHDNAGLYDPAGSGIIGLGGGPLSLISQMEPYIPRKFSYCLVPESKPKVTSKINFGEDAVASVPGTVWTPLVPKSPNTYYYVTLESITVGEKTLRWDAFSSKLANDSSTGNLIIDSGTTMTFVPEELYGALEEAVAKAVNATTVPDPQGMLDPCYRSKGDVKAPAVTLNFAGGASVRLKTANLFSRFDEDLVCFTIVPASELAILGNLAQTDFKVAFDLEKRRVSFTSVDCAKQP